MSILSPEEVSWETWAPSHIQQVSNAWHGASCQWTLAQLNLQFADVQSLQGSLPSATRTTNTYNGARKTRKQWVLLEWKSEDESLPNPRDAYRALCGHSLPCGLFYISTQVPIGIRQLFPKHHFKLLTIYLEWCVKLPNR